MSAKEVILQMPLRADKWGEEQLIQTFVNVGPLIHILKGANNHVLLGRRGTGKTHVFSYLKSQIEKEQGDCCIYIDMRTIGSTGSIYSNKDIPLYQRATRLVSDIIQELRNQIVAYVVRSEENKELYLSEVTPLLDGLCSLYNIKKIEGNVKRESSRKIEQIEDGDIALSISMSPEFRMSSKTTDIESQYCNVQEEGACVDYLDFNALSLVLKSIMDKLAPHKVWLFIDEYAELHTDMQIALSDMIRRIFCPLKNFVFKIAAIEHRSVFKQQIDSQNYIGLELGADCSTCNLDDFMVFGNNNAQAIMFFRELIFRHTNSMLPPNEQYKNSDELVKDIFTQEKAFEELVMAAEGVPRDAFNILAKAITEDYYGNISVNAVRKAAKKWYNEDKLNFIISYPDAHKLLIWIMDNVINQRQARAFLLRNDAEYELINFLYDSRILHIIKQDISSRDTPGLKYNVYSIDYGCYVELINTTRFPLGLFQEELENGEYEYSQVPKDDYRSIRRAILDMDEFYQKIDSYQS